MSNQRKLAELIYNELKEAGAGIGNAARYVIEDTLERNNTHAELIEALRDNLIVLLSNYQAIESLPFEALGVVHPTHEHNGYPIRDEVLHDIAGAIKNTKAAIAKATETCDHSWMVFSTAVATGQIMVECELCEAVGTVDTHTRAEWQAAFHAPSNPYRWDGGDDRITVTGASE